MANAAIKATVTAVWHEAIVVAKIEQEMTHRLSLALKHLEGQVRANLRDPDRRMGGKGERTMRRTDDDETVGIRSEGLESGGNKSERRFKGVASPGLLVFGPRKNTAGNIIAGLGFIKGDKLAAMLEFGLAGNRPFRPVTNAREQAWFIMKQVMGIR